MTSDELKQSIYMREVVERYGIRIDRKGFCCCPFHKEKTPSMKVYKDSSHCFGCGRSDDIFSFVMGMEHCDFKTAFKNLGGTYEKKSNYSHDLFRYRMEKRKQTEEIKKQRLENERIGILKEIEQQKIFKNLFSPMSDDWCDAVNKLENLYYRLEVITTEKR